MKPLRDLLLVEIQPEEQRESGLVIREAWAKPRNVATVLEVGDTVELVKKGDQVVINPYAVIDTAKKEVKIIKEKDLLCLLPQET